MCGNFNKKLRKWSRIIHRDLSFFFSGVIIIYAVSGLVLNHKKDFNSDYSIKVFNFNIAGNYPLLQDDFTKNHILNILEPYNEVNNYTKHYFPKDNSVKVFLKGGSSLEIDLTDGTALYERVRKRPIISQMNWLHYNPNKWWTLFSDIFAFALIIITLTGLFITRGKKGLRGRGGIEFIIGMLIPLGFLFFL
ncbi:MAG TPA: PepSY-associated TM helix domain-containing protein [Dysgonamonadaceae bacterium]|nr:PepSY-associated TM helix domain-containing protein [Dysgonamonadaceae bacterium]